ncbi:MAG: hypothetical protein LBH25_12800 [Fibromonadaceae bacterium]|nr:hypothetical protein [Fibromonadaceae bacterium]
MSNTESKTEDGKVQGSVLSSVFKQNDETIKAMLVERIKGKMKLGQKLSNDEKEFLRKNAPNLYEKAIKIEKEREEHRQALNNCKTKEEARRLHMEKCLQIQMETKAASSDKDGPDLDAVEFMAMRMAAVVCEFSEFAQSSEYEDKPNEYEQKQDSENQNKHKFKKNKLMQNMLSNYEPNNVPQPKGNSWNITLKLA